MWSLLKYTLANVTNKKIVVILGCIVGYIVYGKGFFIVGSPTFSVLDSNIF